MVTRTVFVAMLAITLAVLTRAAAALADIEVVVPDLDGSGPTEPLTIGPLVAVSAGAVLLAAAALAVLERLSPARGRSVVTLVGVLLLAASFIPIVQAELPVEAAAVLVALHAEVGMCALVGVVRRS